MIELDITDEDIRNGFPGMGLGCPVYFSAVRNLGAEVCWVCPAYLNYNDVLYWSDRATENAMTTYDLTGEMVPFTARFKETKADENIAKVL